MTTLVYRDGVLAADSQAGIGPYQVPGTTRKVGTLRDGRLVAFVGSCAGGANFIRWLNAGSPNDPPRLGRDTVVVVVNLDGTVLVHEDEGVFDGNDAPFLAWGSGLAPALGALHVGASAVEAVKAATLVDSASGGPVQSVRLKTPPRSRRNSSPRK